MDPVSTSIVVSAPREQVFDFLADIANHPRFTDHFLADWHLTRIDSAGEGAGARFRVKMPGNRYGWADVTIAEAERGHRIVEVGRAGKDNRVRVLVTYELEPAAAGATRVTFTVETVPATFSDRLLESLGVRPWLRRKTRRALKRLRAILEGEQAPGPRVSVAGG
jgi:uncharacterized protein YndB with AHSA1/START domain